MLHNSLIGQLLLRYKREIIFLIIGAFNTGLDFGVFTLLYALTALSGPICQAVSYTVGVSSSFLLNRNITFRDGDNGRVSTQAVRFTLVNLFSLGVSVLAINLKILAGLPTFWAKVTVTVITMVINYFGYKRFVFRVKE